MSNLKLPKVIGHRGAKAYAPENTLASINAAADMGIEWVELDSKLTKDHIPVIFHDDELDRCTNMYGMMAKTKYSVIQELDAGSWFSDNFKGEKVPTLEEALEVIINRKLKLNLEIKPCLGREIETARLSLELVSRFWDKDDEELPLISSFSPISLETAMNMMPKLPRGLLIENYFEEWKEMAEHLKASTIIIDGDGSTHSQIDEYLNYKKPVLAYTVNEVKRAKELFDMGITSVFSDCPDVIIKGIS